MGSGSLVHLVSVSRISYRRQNRRAAAGEEQRLSTVNVEKRCEGSTRLAKQGRSLPDALFLRVSSCVALDRRAPQCLRCLWELMLTRFGTILLAAMMLIANAICVCAAPARGQAVALEEAPPSRSHPGCHGHSDNQSDSVPEDAPEHDCGHCTNTVIADASASKSSAASPLSCLDRFAVPCATVVISDTALADCLFDHSGLPPPLPPPTLFSLSCSFNS